MTVKPVETLRAFAAALLMVVCAGPARGQESRSKDIDKIGFDQRLDVQVPGDLVFRDETGRTVRLGDYFSGKRPIILTPVYYECPMLCNQELNSLTRSLRAVSGDIGKDFDIVTFSISPSESPKLAAAKRAGYLRQYARPGTAADGWRFLTGDAESIRRLTESIGFRYLYNPETKLYSHSAGIVLLTPTGRVARYLFGINYPARNLQLALNEAGTGKIATPTNRMLLFCYDFDPSTGKYTFAIMRVTRVLGVATALTLAAFMVVMFRRDRRRDKPGLGMGLSAERVPRPPHASPYGPRTP